MLIGTATDHDQPTRAAGERSHYLFDILVRQQSGDAKIVSTVECTLSQPRAEFGDRFAVVVRGHRHRWRHYRGVDSIGVGDALADNSRHREIPVA